MASHSVARNAARAGAEVAPIAAAAVVAFATFARQDGIPKARTIWAEDGLVFAGCAYLDPWPVRCILRPYQGSLFVVPRVGALIAAAAPPLWLSTVLTAVAAAVVAICAFAVARAIARATGSPVSGFLGGTALALVHQAGVEVGGNLTNLHWILLATGIVLIVAGWLERRASRLDVVLVASAGLSSAFAPMLAALAAVAAWNGMVRGRVLLVSSTLAAFAQLAAGIAAPRSRPPGSGVPLATIADGFWTHVVTHGAFGGIAFPPDWIVAAGLGWVLVLLLAGAIEATRPPGNGSGRQRADRSPSRPIVATLALVGTGAVVFAASVFVNRFLNPRYGYVPSVLGIEALVIGAARLRVARARATGSPVLQVIAWATLPVLLALLAIGFVRSFSVHGRASTGPDYVAEYVRERDRCATGVGLIEIATSPRTKTWRVRVPCSRVEPE